MVKARSRYVVCIETGDAEDLEIRKLYRVIPDEAASARGHLRVVDESGEDYLYPAVWFAAIEVSDEAERALANGSLEPTSDRRVP